MQTRLLIFDIFVMVQILKHGLDIPKKNQHKIIGWRGGVVSHTLIHRLTPSSCVFFGWRGGGGGEEHTQAYLTVSRLLWYRLGTVNSNTVNSNFHFIRSFCEMFSFHFPIISCLKCMVNSKFHLIRRKSLPTNDFELTVPDLYLHQGNRNFAFV